MSKRYLVDAPNNPYFIDGANLPADPGPGVTDVENLHRMAAQAPEAPIPLDPLALDPVDVAFLDIEDRLSVVMAERDSLVEQVKALEMHVASSDRMMGVLIRECNKARDGEGVREVVLVAVLRAEQASTRRATYLAALLFCALCWAGAALLWRLI